MSEQTLDSDRLELALRASNEGIWDWLTEEKNIYYSRRILEFLECTESFAPNLFLPPHLPIHHLDRPEFVRAVGQALEQHGPETLAVDARVQTGSSSWRWLRIRGTVVRDRNGDATRIAGSMIDISLRKAAESQIEEERHLLMNLIDHVPLQIYFKDLESKVVMSNRGMAEWLGFDSPKDLIGKHDSDLFANTHWEKAASDEQRIIETGESMTEQLECETWREGRETFVMTSKFPWRDKAGKIKGTFGVSSDVTSLVLAQRQATELAGELQQKNASYEEEVKLAREIQHALFTTKFPKVTSENGNNLTFASRYLPISGLAGDFFEVIPLGCQKYGIFICDVMGHGVRAALVVSMLRGLLATQSTKGRQSQHFLEGVNRGLASILKQANVTMFATAFHGVVDLENLTLTYSCAGHPGPVVIEANSSRQLCTERGERGPALGLFPDASYSLQTMDLTETKRLLLFTDGVLEAENKDGEQFMENRLIQLASKDTTAPMSLWLDNIIETVLNFSDGHHFDDDVCLLGIEITQGA
ncbi:MAG: SpoIIE family protein phosphatase [Verrucomicrobia bacterium]|jgi:sigma-B regulation protein RsbU (phosphoserine phosphatase)|nr:SpoIIE family protein phosphatase [Verrucomicrobiota bacterium]|tara:strand:- start:9550 stop:11139 length:1590 start_codon:yes stop_codon:yes gene_type:complete